MKIYHGIEDFVRLSFAVVTSGTFDGVHVGHQKILSRLQEIATKKNGETVVITFWPHPRLVLHPEDTALKLLNTFEEKAELLKAQGIHHLSSNSFYQRIFTTYLQKSLSLKFWCKQSELKNL